ncbi:MAG: O-antigen ligase family protein [Elusimicrobia bacterium]|nr:O-antigen ligase family protein [Elusimicrobiota bacterium]
MAGLPFCDGVGAVFTLPKLAALGLAVLLCAVASALGGPPRRSTALDLPLLGVLAALGLSAAFSVDKVLSVLGMYNYYAYGVWPMAMAACLAFFAARADDGVRRDCLRAFVAAGALAGVYAGVQASGIEPFPSVGTVLTGGRAISTVGSPVSLGAFEAMALPVALWCARQGGGRASLLGWVGLALVGTGLLASGSRAGWLGALAGVAAFVALSGKAWPKGARSSQARAVLLLPGTAWPKGARSSQARAVLLSPGTAGAPMSRGRRAAVAACLLGLGAILFWRMSARKSELSELDRARMEVWGIAWKTFQGAPWLGTGPDTFELAFRRGKTEDYVKVTTTEEYQAHAHNDILQVLATTGLLGAAAYAWLLWTLIVQGGRSLADPGRRLLAAAPSGERRTSCACEDGVPLAAAAGSGLFSLFVCMKFNPVPLETFAAAALLGGFLIPAETGEGEKPRAAGVPRQAGPPAGPLWAALAAALVLFGGASVFLSLRLAAADRWAKRAVAEIGSGRNESAKRHYERALALNPCELIYHMGFINYLTALAAGTPDAAARASLLDRASELGRQAVSCHPDSSLAHFCLGTAELIQAQAGRTERLALAEAELDRAIAADPNFKRILDVRLKAALLRGDAAARDRLIQRIVYLHALPHRYNSPPPRGGE